MTIKIPLYQIAIVRLLCIRYYFTFASAYAWTPRHLLVTGTKSKGLVSSSSLLTPFCDNKYFSFNTKSTYITHAKLGACAVTGTQEKGHGDVDEAVKYYSKISKEKLKKGHTDCTEPGSGPPVAASGNKNVKNEPAAATAARTPAEDTPTSCGGGPPVASSTVYLELVDGISDKFYELKMHGTTVTIRYGRRGTAGTFSKKSFGSEAEAQKFVDKSVCGKRNKGYSDTFEGNDAVETALAAAEAIEDDDGPISLAGDEPFSDPRSDLEAGKRVYIAGSGKLPYILRKFNGGYSCTCFSFTKNIKKNGIQASSCKHLKLIRGEEAEALRCGTGSAGSRAGKDKASTNYDKNPSIVKKISLAYPWRVGMDPSGYVMSEKLDGMRAYWDGKGRLWTRRGERVAAPDWFLQGLPADVELDGELFLGRQQFDACMSIARQSDASDDWRRLTYVIFDAPLVSGGITTRLAAIRSLIDPETGLTPYARIHPHEMCRGADHLMEELAHVEQVGGEGLMLRNAASVHRGGRTNDLLKVKSFYDAEALITAHEEGSGKYKGMVGSLVCILKDGSAFKVGSGLSDSERTFDSAPKIGSVITFKYFELTKDGIPRFPTFLRIRHDVEASDFTR